MRSAVLCLLSEGQHFNSLTVSEVATKAGVTRKTLYARFGSLEQVVREIAYDMFVTAAANLGDQRLIAPTFGSDLSSEVFSALRADKATLQPLMTQCPSSLVIEPSGKVFRMLLDRTTALNQYEPLSEFQRDYLTAIVGSTIHGMVLVWIERNFIDSADDLGQMFLKVIGPGMNALLNQT